MNPNIVKMASEGNPNPNPTPSPTPNSSSVNGGGFKSKVEHFLYSGDKKHVFAGLVAITAVFAVPWYFMTREDVDK
ncbi:SWR1-complex protein 4 [Bienertia sinuspersici]